MIRRPLALLVCTLALLGGFTAAAHAGRAPAPLYTPEPIAIPARATPAQVEAAIREAIRERGWTGNLAAPGHFVAVLHVRKHIAKVNIRFNAKTVTMAYRDSVLLNYAKEDGRETIHNNYNGWVMNLERGVRAAIAALE